jgi:hypothetical protein
LVVDVEVCRLGGGEVRRLWLGEAFPDLAMVVSVIDEPLFSDPLLVRGLFLVVFFALATVCDIAPVIGLRGSDVVFSFVFLMLLAALLS